jgi:hypothetical protein
MRIGDERDHRRLILLGLAERTGTFTLATGAGNTTLIDARIRSDSPVILVPATMNAAAEIAAGTLWVQEAGRVNGSVVITHANNAVVDRIFRYMIG